MLPTAEPSLHPCILLFSLYFYLVGYLVLQFLHMTPSNFVYLRTLPFPFSHGGGQACVCECTLPVEARAPSGAEARGGCEQPDDLGPLEEQCVLFTTEPPLHLDFRCVCLLTASSLTIWLIFLFYKGLMRILIFH